MASLKEQKEELISETMMYIEAMIDDAIANGDIGKVRHTAIQFTTRWLRKLKREQLANMLEASRESYSHLVPPKE